MTRRFSWAVQLVGLAVLVASQAWAVPALPQSRTFTQPDGTVITGTLHGDEWLNWYRTGDGRLFIRNPMTRAFEYASLAERNGQRTLVSTNVRVGSASAWSASPAEDVSDDLLYELAAAERERAGIVYEGMHKTTLADVRARGFAATAMAPRTFKTLIVMVEFSDTQITSPVDTWAAKIFGTAQGQLNHFYDQMSYGKVQFEPAVESEGIANDGFVRVRLNYPHPAPGGELDSAKFFLAEALSLADAWVDFSSFDVDGNGRLSGSELQVGFLIAGGEAARGDEKSIWAHAGTLPDRTLLDGVSVVRDTYYFCWGERHGDHDATVGVIAHEVGHSAFFLPDLYPNLEHWDLMSWGSSGQAAGDTWSGETPVPMSAHTRWQAGFIDATWVDPMYASTTHTLHRALSATPNLVVTALPNSWQRHFSLEYRRIEGYDLGLTGFGVSAGSGGVLVLSEKAIRNGLHLVKAGTNSISNYLFHPGNNDRLAPETTPNTNDPRDGTVTGFIFSDIAYSGDAMSVRIARAPTVPGADCRLFAATNSAHVSAGRVYTATTGIWWKTTTWYAVGSNENLGTLATTQVTLKETPAGHFSRGSSCPAQSAPVFSDVQLSLDGPRAVVEAYVDDPEKDLVRIEIEVDASGMWQKLPHVFDDFSSQKWTLWHQIDGLAQGPHSYQLRATDAGGRVTVYGPVQFIAEGSRAPACTIDRVHRDGEGYWAAWGRTSDPDGSLIVQVEVRLDGGAGRPATVDSGAWTLRLSQQPNDLANGSYTVAARVTDDTGLSATCGPFEFEVGVDHPASVVVDQATPFADGIILNGAAVDVDGDLVGVEVEFDGNGQWQSVSDYSPNGFDPTTAYWSERRMGLAIGPHTVRVRAVDAAGLHSPPSAPFAFEVFAPEPPVCVIDSVDMEPGYPLITGTVTDRNNDAFILESFLIDHGTWSQMWWFGGSEFMATAAEVNPPAGRYTAQIRVGDSRSEYGYCSREFVVGAAPTLGAVQVAPHGLSVTVSGTATDPDGDLTGIEVQYDDEYGPWLPANGTTAWSHTHASLGAGEHRVRVRARDATGLTSAPTAWRSFTLSDVQCFTGTNSAHASAGRAAVKYNVLYYANGSNDYLGLGTATTSLQQQGSNSWKKVAACP